MDRREFINSSIMATVAAKVVSDATLARAQAPAAAGAQTAAAPRKLTLDAYTRFFQWIRDPDQLAEATIEITCGGVEPTVQPYPGHIDPAKVATELPAFVKTMQKHGLKVSQVRGGNETDASQPNVEPMLATMGQLGVRCYWLGTDNYDFTKPILPQLDAIKKKVEGFVRLNEKHGTTLMYHTRAGANSVGSVVWDLLYVLKDFDPKYVGLHWDTGHMSHHGSNMWETLLRTAGPYVVAVSWKDRSWKQELGLLGEGGPYPGPVEAARQAGISPAAGRGGPGGPGAPGAPGAPAGRAGAPAASALGEFGPGGGGGRGGPRTMPLPLAGKLFARGSGWTSPYVPMGTGLVDIFRYGVALRDISFNGPMELEVEYPLGGAERGADKITLPRINVIGAIKRDVLTIRAGLNQSGSGIEI